MKIEEGLPDNPLDEPAADRVARGVRLLDEYRPEWRQMVSPDRLDMEAPMGCVAGQAFGSYVEMMRITGITTSLQATRYGFHAVEPDVSVPGHFRVNYDALSELHRLWMAELTREPVTTP